MKVFRHLLWAAAALAALSAQALTVGSLSRSDGSHFIVDSLNQREWLGWDLNKDLSYAQTLAAIAPGGAYQGFQMADQTDALLFATALLGPSHTCTGLPDWAKNGIPQGGFPPSAECGSVRTEAYTLVDSDGGTLSPAAKQVYFLSEEARFEVGALELSSSQNPALATFYFKSAIGSFEQAQARFEEPTPYSQPLSWLLYRDTVSPVPEASTQAMVAAGLLVLGVWRRRRPPA